jgi:hypothetical protein
VTCEIDYHDGTYLLSADAEDQVREAVVIGSPTSAL